MFHKKAPYNTREARDPMALIKNSPLSFDYELDPRIRGLIKQMLKIQPFERPSCKEILNHKDLRDIAKECSIDLLNGGKRHLQRNK